MTAVLDRFVNVLNLRTLALLLGLWLAVAPPPQPSLQWLDGVLFSAVRTLSADSSATDRPDNLWGQDAQRYWWMQTDRLNARIQNSMQTVDGISGRAAPAPDEPFQALWWFPPAHSLLVLLLAAYVCALVPRLRLSVALLATLLLFVLLVVAQLGAGLARSQWLPLGLAGQYLWLGLLLVGCWHYQGRWQRLYQRAASELSVIKMQQGDWSGASAALARCPNSPQVLLQLYGQGRQHEAQQRYREARRVYSLLAKRQRHYRDVAKRLARLEGAPARKTSGTTDLAQTMVLESAQTPSRLGRYEIERELGRGAMGIVYLGHDPHIARPLAIKTLRYGHFEPSEREAVKARFFREAEAAGRLRHPQIVTVYDLGEEPDLAYIVMDYIEGEPLSDHAVKGQLLPVLRVYQVVAQVAEALAYAHSQDVVHRDIKPGNILYRRSSNQVTVTDFGIARIASSARTQTGEIFGSPLYMSPEQLRGQQVGEASDIFSLGVTLYQLLSGAPPFKGDNIAELSYQIVQGRHRNIRDVRPQLPRSATRIINKSLQKQPQQRYASAADMARALRKAIERDF